MKWFARENRSTTSPNDFNESINGNLLSMIYEEDELEEDYEEEPDDEETQFKV